LLSLCDGYLKRLLADAAVVDVANVSIDATNVIAQLTAILNAAPATIKRKKADLRFYVSSNIATAYELAAAQGNTQTFVTIPLALTFLGIKW